MEMVDEETGVMDRKSFYDRVRSLLDEYADLEFEMMVTDVERFHIANELLGEEAGDELLHRLGDCLKANEFELSAVGRLYSDHFAVFYPAKQSIRDHIIKSLQEIAAGFSDHYMITLDFGIYPVHERELLASVMCDRAKMALQRAKGNYMVNCSIYDEDMHQAAIRKQFVVNSMEEALAKKQFLIWLQPKYDLRTEKIVGAEALVRWQHPEHGFLSPAMFIPVFEDNGFIMKLDAYIWEETCRLLARWREEGRLLLPVSINVSRVDLHNPHLSELLLGLVQKYDLPPALLELEITESAYTEDARQIIAFTETLRQHGFTILMDDFGSGYSSLNMLKDVPVDILKLDLHFLSSDDTSGRGGNILNSIVRMAKWLNLEVIAEGVETQQQADFLRSIGCRFVQGYYYSRPLPVDAYEKLLTAAGVGTAELHTDAAHQPMEDIWSPLAQYNLLFNNMACGIGLVALSSVGLELLRGNDGYYPLVGVERVLQKGAKVQQALPFLWPEDEKLLQEALQNSEERASQTEIVVRYQRPDGLAWLNISVAFVEKELQQTLFYLFVHDVTKQYEKADMLQHLFDELPSGIGVYEMRGKELLIRYISHSVAEFHGVPEMQQRLRTQKVRLAELVGEASAADFYRAVCKAYAKQPVFRLQYPVLDGEGSYCWISIICRGVKGVTGSLFFYASFTKLLNTPFLQQRMWIYDVAADRLYLGRYLQETFKEKSMVIDGAARYFEEHRWMRPEDADPFYAMLDRLRTGAAEDEWSGVSDIHGQKVWVHLVAYTILDAAGKTALIVCSSV